MRYRSRMSTSTARRLHALVEPIAATIFFSPEAEQAYGALGLDPTQGYVCSRSAPMGRVTADVVVAVFYSFDPAMIRAALRWDLVDPASILAARMDAAAATMRRLLMDDDGTLPDLSRIVDAMHDVVRACRPEGRPLAAAHASLPWPDDEPTALWHAATTLREYRGDGHVAVLQSHGIDAAEALVLDEAWSGRPPAYYAYRQTEDAALSRARVALRERGFIDGDGALTDGGAKFREMIEIDTDRLAWAPFSTVDQQRLDDAIQDLMPLVARIGERRGFPRFLVRLFRASFPG